MTSQILVHMAAASAIQIVGVAMIIGGAIAWHRQTVKTRKAQSV